MAEGAASVRRFRPSIVDAAIALLLLIAALGEAAVTDLPGPRFAVLLAAVLTTVPLAWRTLAPIPTVAVTIGALAVAGLLGADLNQPLVPTLAPMVALYSVGLHSTFRAILGATAIVLTASFVAYGAAEPAIVAAGWLIAVAVGRAVREMGFESETLEARAAELEREGEEKAHAAVATERARIARELHDVIGHSISVMGVQAGAVRRLLAPDQEREREALLAVERTGREAVAEMRRLLGLLRETDPVDTRSEPVPTLSRLDDLVADMRRAGLDVELRTEGDLHQLPTGPALAAFRILQEALTNALRHAPGAHVRASVRRTNSHLEIEVVDDGARRPTHAANDGGLGLVGMRERVLIYGGTLEAGPRADRGFAVLARLPTRGD